MLIAASARHCSACSAVSPASSTSSARDLLRPDLVELVDDPHHRVGVGDAEPAVEALDQLAVVDLQPQPAGSGRPRQRLGHHPGDLDVVVERQGVAADDVDVGLGELAVAALLRPLAAPHLLDLVAPERELELAGVLEHVAGERHGQVEVQAERRRRRRRRRPAAGAGRRPPCRSRPCAAAGRAARRRGSRRGEAVQLEGRAQRVEDVLLDDALARAATRGTRSAGWDGLMVTALA